jgi:hypothetical protein
MKKLYFLFLLIVGLNVYAQNPNDIVYIPDVYFKGTLLQANTSNFIASTQPFTVGSSVGSYNSIDINNDGEIQYSEAAAIKWLRVVGTFITDLTGLQSFVNLQYFNCAGNNQLTSLNINYLLNLKQLNCENCSLTSLNVNTLSNLEYINCDNNELPNANLSNLSNLKYLSINFNGLTTINLPNVNSLEKFYCVYNQLSSLNLSSLTNLTNVIASNNQLTSLDVTGLSNLFELDCSFNQLTNLNVSGLADLYIFYCSNNQLTGINMSGSTNLQQLRCQNNLLQTLNIDSLANLSMLNCGNNQLINVDASATKLFELNCNNNSSLLSINMKNGRITTLDSSNCPNLQYICADDTELANIETLITNYGYTNCHVNSYCSFTLGGTFYTISGMNRFDNNSNGCDVNDFSIPNQKFSVTNGTIAGSVIANQSGNYTVPVQAGTHTLTPVLENPTYFNVSPTSVTVTFPATTSPSIQNFCISPNGIHKDLEVALSPISAAIPGFDATYMVIYKNSGNQIENGVVTVSFNDAVLDFVSATPALFTQVNNLLSWTFQDLLPLETRVIYFKLNLNSPMESPAVNSGDILNFTGGIVLTTADENSSNNFSGLQQTVVNSFDPNDKTCLEGTSITPDMIGKYVHYMIRFENTGTFPAENIVVKDIIDATKFDVASLIPLSASHDYITRITGNKVEFIFENINLPFDDATNDGYIVFKIKTLPTLALGDSFSNSASIYFDYNFPIVTDPAVTTFAVLGTEDFVFNNYLTVYPNPTNDVLNLTAKQAIELQSIAVYNVLGQLVLSVPNANGVSTVDVSNLTAGNYFLKVVSDKGISNTKFIKK